MATMKVTPGHEKFIKAYSKQHEVSAEEGLERILNIAQSRLNALANYAKATGGAKKTKKSAKKAAKATKVKAKAKTKSAKKVSAKSKGPKTRKASAAKKSAGVPKGFKANSAPEPVAQTEAAAAS
jgi:hypothetical protein